PRIVRQNFALNRLMVPLRSRVATALSLYPICNTKCTMKRNASTHEIKYTKDSTQSTNPFPSREAGHHLQFPARSTDSRATPSLRGLHPLHSQLRCPRSASASFSK